MTLTAFKSLTSLSLMITVFLILCLPGSPFAQDVSTKPNPVLRQEWIKKTKAEMKSSAKDDKVKSITPTVIRFDSITRTTYRVPGEGRIEFGPGEWIYIVLHSSHQQPEIGDVMLAMDDDRQFYVNYSHICGDMVHFRCDENVKVASSDDFIRHFREDIDLSPLEKLDSQ